MKRSQGKAKMIEEQATGICKEIKTSTESRKGGEKRVSKKKREKENNSKRPTDREGRGRRKRDNTRNKDNI